MNIYKYDIVFQEVPGEISLAFYVCGCPLKCAGCHSPELWTEKTGTPLVESLFLNLLENYKGQISCVLFMGGEWHSQQLTNFLSIAAAQQLKTALYTGLEQVDPAICAHLDYLKVGPWIRERGGLNNQETNQIFWDLKAQKKLNHLFWT